jgi:two-component system response regulator MtrA
VAQRILVVDDDPSIAEMLGIVLRAEGYDTSFCSDGAEAMAVFSATNPDLVLLDLMLPGTDGVDVCREIRKVSGVPIVMLTARSDSHDVVTGLESGADDYIVKPAQPTELVARVRARLRKVESAPSNELRIADLVIDVAGHEVRRGDTVITLTTLEFKLLTALASRPGTVFTRENLLEEVWGHRHTEDTRLVNVHVQRLRAKVERDPENHEVVLTVRGLGYKAGPV